MNHVSLLALVTLAFAAGCDRASSTSGREVTLRTSLVADAELERTFDTQTGWSVRLSRAAVSLGALYYFEGEPAFVLRGPRSAWQRLAGLLRPSVARAHPGHYTEGDATGQMTEPQAVELSTTRQALADGRGVTGRYRSGRLVLAEAEDSQVDGLDGHVALAEGVATKDEQTVHFRLAASFADVARSVSKGQVNGCVFEEAEVHGDGAVTVSIKPRVWFNLVDFSDVASGSEGEPTEIAAGETPQLAFALGVVQLSAYRFSFEQEE
jgi:hypothetical protein